jgi:hypothetical protein
MGGKGNCLPAHGNEGPSHFLPWDGTGPSHMGNPMGMSMSIPSHRPNGEEAYILK